MALVKGTVAEFSVATQDLSDYLTSVKVSRTVDALDVTTLGSTGKRYVSGLSDGTVSLEGIYDSTAMTGPAAVLKAALQDDTVACLWKPEGTGTGKAQAAFNAILTSYEESAPAAEMVTFTAEFQIDGTVTLTAQS